MKISPEVVLEFATRAGASVICHLRANQTWLVEYKVYAESFVNTRNCVKVMKFLLVLP